MRGKALVLGFTAAAALLFGGAASAVAVERIPLSPRPETPGFPPGVFLTLVSPPQYVAQSPGRWVGPEYWASGDSTRRGNAIIDWSVSFRDRSVEPDSAAAAATPRGLREQERAGISIPHVHGRNVLGTVPSYFVLKNSDALHDAALAIPLSATAIAIIRFTFAAPATNTVPGSGDNLVLGSFLASSWNRGQAFLALSGVQLEGNLPPSVVSIRYDRRKRALRGKVVDSFKHPLVGVPVGLERRAGSGWRRAGSTRTSAQGTFSFGASGAGRYRATVTVAGTTIRSGSVPTR